MILEKTVEQYLVDRVTMAGGVADKVTSPGGRGYFDRVVVLGGGRVIFVECKKPRGGRVSMHQVARHARYRQLGAEVAVVKTFADVDRLLAAGVHQDGTRRP
jgi:tRNA U54 and U55 pseudouridine synthase Pus10